MNNSTKWKDALNDLENLIKDFDEPESLEPAERAAQEEFISQAEGLVNYFQEYIFKK